MNYTKRLCESIGAVPLLPLIFFYSLPFCGIIQVLNILAKQYRDSGIMSTDVPDEDTGIDRLDCFPQNSHQCQAQSRFAVHSRLDIVVDSEIIDAANQAFYCGTL